MMKTVLLAVAWLGLLLAPSFGQSATTPPPTVGVITAAETPIYNEASYTGRIQSPKIVALDARVTGYLEAQDFKDGDSVTQGQLLYLIEQPPYQAAVAQAQAAVQSAEAQSRNANIMLGRAQALLHTPAGLPSSVDSNQANASSSAASIAEAKAQLQTAEIDLGYTEIRAPVTGRISATNVDVGNVVGPGSGALATIVSEDPIYVLFAVPVVDALKLRDEQAAGGFGAVEVLIVLPDGRRYGHTAGIDFVNNRITSSTDTLTLRATIANPPLPGMTDADTGQRELQDGEFVNVVLRDREPQQRITVPQQAVVPDQLGDYVVVVGKDGITRRQVVSLGQSTPSAAVVLSGLKPGDSVVAQGAERVHPGAKVKPEPANSAPLPPSGQE